MMWNEEAQTEIDRTLSQQDPREVIAVAISGLIRSRIEQALCSVQLANPLTDPAIEADYNERLLSAALDKLEYSKATS